MKQDDPRESMNPKTPAPTANQRTRHRAIAGLTKFPITLLSTLSAVTGYGVYSRRLEAGMITCALGVLLIAMGACALNQCQDRKFDALMLRTQGRPLPAGALSLNSALWRSALLLISGFVLLGTRHGPDAALVALGAVAWYNGLYTYLKRVWAFAVVPGAVIGALPPIIGWAAAGGDPLAPRIVAFAFFIFMWQVPHFWLLLFTYGADYRQAGLPSVTGIFSPRQFARLTSVWMLATVASSLILPLFYLVYSRWALRVLAVAGLWLLWHTFRLVKRPPEAFLPVFHAINLYALILMALLNAEALL